MFQRDRHEPVAGTAWSDSAARAAIDEIVASTLAAFSEEKLWPAHPLDTVPDGLANVYMGASGVILALDYLKRAGATRHAFDFADVLPKIVEKDNAWLNGMPLGAHGSLLFGDMGNHLVAMRVAPRDDTSDRIFTRAGDNDRLPLLELMWGTPGSMLACIFMHGLTGEERFEMLYRRQAARLLADLAIDKPRLWTQELYGKRTRYIGFVHGFAGNMFSLQRGWKWLTPQQRQTAADAALLTLAMSADQSDGKANWPADANEPGAPLLCQICHGAPGILAGLADAPFASSGLDDLLIAAGELTWAAGPLKKGSNFCHGTGGNAYALLKLFKRTGDGKWLERARQFAMHAIGQLRAATSEYGRGRYSLWTGDAGLAVCLWNCIAAEPYFPGLDGL